MGYDLVFKIRDTELGVQEVLERVADTPMRKMNIKLLRHQSIPKSLIYRWIRCKNPQFGFTVELRVQKRCEIKKKKQARPTRNIITGHYWMGESSETTRRVDLSRVPRFTSKRLAMRLKVE